MILVTVVSLMIAGLLSTTDTGVRATTALRAQGSEFYAADGATQAAINTIRNSTFNGQPGQTCFPNSSNTLQLPNFNGTDSAAVTCVPGTSAPPPVTCPAANGCDPPTVTAQITQPGCVIDTLWILSGDDRMARELLANGTSTGRTISVPGPDPRDVAISLDGGTMYILHNDGQINTIDISTRRVTRTIDVHGSGVPTYGNNTRAANSLSMAPNGKLYLGNSALSGAQNPGSEPVLLVDPTLSRNNARVVGTLPGPSGGDFVTMSDGSLLAAGADGSLYMFTVRSNGTLSSAVDVGSVPRRWYAQEGRSYGPFGLATVNGTAYAAYSDGVGRISPTPSITNSSRTSYSTTPLLRTPGNLSNGNSFNGAASAQESVACGVPTNVTVSTPVVSGPNPTGVYTANSTVRVTNTSSTNGTYTGLTLTATSNSEATVTAASWTRPDGTTGTGSVPGPWTISSGVRNLNAGATDTYQVSTTFTKPPTSATSTELVAHLDTHLCPQSATCAPNGRPARRAKVAFIDADPTAPVKGQRQVKIISWSNQQDQGTTQ